MVKWFSSFLVVCLLAGFVLGCNLNWYQDKANMNTALWEEYSTNSGDGWQTDNNTIRMCTGTTANYDNSIFVKKNTYSIISDSFTVISNISNLTGSNPLNILTGVVRSNFSIDNTGYFSGSDNILGIQYQPGSILYTYCYGIQAAHGVPTDIKYPLSYRFRRGLTSQYLYIDYLNNTNEWEGGYSCLIPNVTAFKYEDLRYYARAYYYSPSVNYCMDLNSIYVTTNTSITASYNLLGYLNSSVNGVNCTVFNIVSLLGSDPYVVPNQQSTFNGITPTFTYYPSCIFNPNIPGYEYSGIVLAECPGYDDVTNWTFLNSFNSPVVVNITFGNFSGTPLTSTTTTTTSTTTTTLISSLSLYGAAVPGNVKPGDSFIFYASFKDGGLLDPYGSCYYNIEPIDLGSFVPSPGWAYTIDSNLDAFNQSVVAYRVGSEWNYKNGLTLYVNGSISPGTYYLYLYCRDTRNNKSAQAEIPVDVVTSNYTTLTFLNVPPNDIQLNSQIILTVEYKDSARNNIPGAYCYYQDNDNFYALSAISGSRYQKSVLFNSAGDFSFNITCNKTGYTDGFLSKTVYVSSGHCFNNIKDANEEGIDCGGDCIACNQNETGGGGCLNELDDCVKDSDCCEGWCTDAYSSSKVCITPTCNDGYKNQGEKQTDCGGSNCPKCPSCLYDSDCSDDGSQYCTSDYQCEYQTCTTNADCRTLRWEVPGIGVVNKQSFCDSHDWFCRFDVNIPDNSSFKLNMDILPITGFMANLSGTLFYTLNCDKGSNGFRVLTNKSSLTYYSFASSGFSPSIGYDPYLRSFGSEGAVKSELIPELCNGLNGFGGIPVGSNSVFAKINFRSCSGSDCVTKIVDVINYRHNLKSDTVFGLNLVNREREFSVNATNRSIFLQVKRLVSDQYTNISSEYVFNVLFNVSQLGNGTSLVDVFYYRIITPYGEFLEDRHGDLFWMPITWDSNTNWFKLNFTVQQWHLWIFLALVVVGLVYANYRLQANRRRSNPQP